MPELSPSPLACPSVFQLDLLTAGGRVGLILGGGWHAPQWPN